MRLFFIVCVLSLSITVVKADNEFKYVPINVGGITTIVKLQKNLIEKGYPSFYKGNVLRTSVDVSATVYLKKDAQDNYFLNASARFSNGVRDVNYILGQAIAGFDSNGNMIYNQRLIKELKGTKWGKTNVKYGNTSIPLPREIAENIYSIEIGSWIISSKTIWETDLKCALKTAGATVVAIGASYVFPVLAPTAIGTAATYAGCEVDRANGNDFFGVTSTAASVFFVFSLL